MSRSQRRNQKQSKNRNQKQSKNRNQKRNKSQRGGDLTSEDKTKIVEMVDELKEKIEEMPVVEMPVVVEDTEGDDKTEGAETEGDDKTEGAETEVVDETENAVTEVDESKVDESEDEKMPGGRKSRRRKQRKNRKSQRKQKRR